MILTLLQKIVMRKLGPNVSNAIKSGKVWNKHADACPNSLVIELAAEEME